MSVLCIGDVVGEAGCEFVRRHLPAYKKLRGIDVCVANGENSAQGNGVTPHSAEHLLASGVDLITTGNHTYRRAEAYAYLDSGAPIIRPANHHKSCPGTGVFVIDKGRYSIAVVNIIGAVGMEPCANPFDCIDGILLTITQTKNIIMDFHAEATAEKRAMGFYLDGRITALFGTHTHVQTTDACLLPNGTGYITDLGMTGPIHSVLGVVPELAIEKMRTGMPVRFDNPKTDCKMEGCIFELDEKTGKALSCEYISIT
ncbi:MAG: TIGR00282 family metallophosphoesterase [Oscillospiraceae bacterium]|nr:TIGR00282 family metallophosphoesterase [Oscillospiraceae bacterium]